MNVRRLFGAVVVLWLAMTALAPAAGADAAGPTDYNTEIISVEPPTPSIELTMIGGDSFMRLELLDAVDVLVVGYQGEDYLRFDADGVVLENRRSPSMWLNRERYGTEDTLPDTVHADAPPQWIPVSESGAYAWHDHRTHWMNPVRPPGAEAGDQVLEATVPLVVDGVAVTVTVASWLLDDPPLWPSALGAVIGLGVAATSARGARTGAGLAALAVGTAGLVLGWTAWASVPAETEPERLLWLLPAVGAACAAAMLAIRRRLATTVYLDGLLTVAGVVLAAWGATRFTALTKALIPSDAPAWLDRMVIAAALVAGVAIAGRGVWGLIHPERIDRA